MHIQLIKNTDYSLFTDFTRITQHWFQYQYPPLALSEGPGGDDPERDHEDEEDGAGADRHQGF